MGRLKGHHFGAHHSDGLSLPPTASVERQSWTRAFVMCARAPAPPGPARPGIRPDNGTEPNPGGPRSRAGGVTGGVWVAAAAEAASWGGGGAAGGAGRGETGGGPTGAAGVRGEPTRNRLPGSGGGARRTDPAVPHEVRSAGRPGLPTALHHTTMHAEVSLCRGALCSRNGKQAQRSMSFVVFIYSCSESPHPLPSLAPALPTPPPAGVGAEAGGRGRGRPRVTTAVAATAAEAAAASGDGNSGDGGDGNGSAVAAMAAATPSPPPPLTALTPISAHCRRQRPLKNRRRQMPLEIPVAG